MRAAARDGRRLAGAVLLLLAAAGSQPGAGAPPPFDFGAPEPVAILGYAGDAMEPFLTRDGRYLLFNDTNAPGADTDLHLAERIDDLTFAYLGELAGALSPTLDAVPSTDVDGRFYFVSLRSYQTTLSSLFRGWFADGEVSGVEPVAGVSLESPGWVNFDAEISWDGAELYFVDGFFAAESLPGSADLAVARAAEEGFVRRPESPAWFAAVNSGALEYAPAVSVDGLELLFTRIEPGEPPRIYRAIRLDPEGPFGPPALESGIEGTVEAPALTADALAVYYHRESGGGFSIWRARRDSRLVVFADGFERGFRRWSGVAGGAA